MGANCVRFQRGYELVNGRGVFNRIVQPRIGDVLTTRISDGVKQLVCEETGTIACLAPGDRVSITIAQCGRRFQERYLAGESSGDATFGMDDGDHFVTDAGTMIPINALNRRLYLTVLSMVPQRHTHPEPEYDAGAVERMLEGVEEAQPVLVTKK